MASHLKDCLRMQRLYRTLRFPVSEVQTLIREARWDQVARALSALPKEVPLVSQPEWTGIVDSVLSQPTEGMHAVFPSMLITSASLGFTLCDRQKRLISRNLKPVGAHMSEFDKIVFLIGASQLGLRTGETVDFAHGVLSDLKNSLIPEKLLVPLMLAVANLGLSYGTEKLVPRLAVERLSPHELANTALAILTSRAFPIAAIERVLDAAFLSAEKFNPQDALSLTHSLCGLEVFRPDLIRTLLNQISTLSSIDPDESKLLKQIVLSLFLDDKASELLASLSPVLLTRIDKLLDWNLQEPSRNLPGDVVGEISEILQEHSYNANITPVPKLPDWSRNHAQTVALNRFYRSDVEADENLFIHIDDETFPDLDEGPIDPFLQLKHLQVRQAGAKLVWVRPAVWEDLNGEEKVGFIKGAWK